MKKLMVIFLLALGLTLDTVMGGCKKCEEKKNKECVKDVCRCQAGYYYVKSSDTCSEECSNLASTFQEYPKSMVEQGKAMEEIYLGSANSPMDECITSCINHKKGCVGFSFKRNENSDRSRCFLYSSTPLEVYQQWKTHKGRWSYFQRDCE